MPPSSRRKLFQVSFTDQLRSAWGRLAWPSPGPGELDDAARGLGFYRSRGSRHGMSEEPYPDAILHENREWRKQAQFAAIRANSTRAATAGGIMLKIGPIHRGIYTLFWDTPVPAQVSLYQLPGPPRTGQSVPPSAQEYLAKFDIPASKTPAPFPVVVWEGNWFAIIGNQVAAGGAHFVELVPISDDYTGYVVTPTFTGAPE